MGPRNTKSRGFFVNYVLGRIVGVYTRPDFSTLLQQSFPGSEWVPTDGSSREQLGPDSLHPGTLEMVCIGHGPGPKNVLATDGVVYPYRKFKALRGRPITTFPLAVAESRTRHRDRAPDAGVRDSVPPRGETTHNKTTGKLGPDSMRPSPASTVPVASSQPSTGPLPPGGARAVAVIGGTKYDSAALQQWIRSLLPDTVIVTGNGRGAEQRVRELGAELGLRVDVPALHPERYGRKALDVKVSYVLSMTAGDIVLIA